MKRIIAVVCTFLIFAAVPAAAADKPRKPVAKPAPIATGSVTLTQDQFMALLNAATKTAAAGSAGVAGTPGRDGVAGSQGAKGDAGVGTAGAAGRDGVDGATGRDGVGFVSGVIFLVNGSCPDGTTMQGDENRWTVYANNTDGRPWTTTGSSSQLFLSACQVN